MKGWILLMKKLRSVLALLMVFCMMLAAVSAFAETEAKTDQQEDSSAVSVIEIDSVEKLADINKNLSGNYVLTADIDLEGSEWTPVGAFVMGGGEEGEMPDLTAAFTGTFDGQGHSIKNLKINQPEGWALGFFGCIANSKIGNFTLENATVDGSVMASDVVGYSYCSEVSKSRDGKSDYRL